MNNETQTKPNALNSEPSPLPVIEDSPYDETFDAIWEAHVQQLIPCSLCQRTFFPDRIEVHQRNCKGLINKAAAAGKGSTLSLRSIAATGQSATGQSVTGQPANEPGKDDEAEEGS